MSKQSRATNCPEGFVWDSTKEKCERRKKHVWEREYLKSRGAGENNITTEDLRYDDGKVKFSIRVIEEGPRKKTVIWRMLNKEAEKLFDKHGIDYRTDMVSEPWYASDSEYRRFLDIIQR